MCSTFNKILIVTISLTLMLAGQTLDSQHENTLIKSRPDQHSSVNNSLNGGYPHTPDKLSRGISASDLLTKKGAYLPESAVGDTIRYWYSHNGSRLHSILAKTPKNGVWVNLYKDSYSYDGHGNMTILLHEEWVNNAWEVASKRTCQYDSFNRIFAQYEDIWDNNVFRPIERFLFYYDNAGNLVKELKEIWFNNDWLNSSQMTWTYDLQKNQLTRKLEYFINGAWQNHELHTWTYDNNSNFNSWTYQNWDNNQWTNSEMETYTWNSFRKMLTWLYHQWVNNSWTILERGEFTYGINLTLVKKLFQYLDNGNWLDYARYTYTYNSSGNGVSGQFQRKDNDNNIWYSDWGSICLYYNYMSEFIVIRAKTATASYKVDLTGVEEDFSAPLSFSLSQNYPNPFNPATTIGYDIPREAAVKLTVYDVLGNEVARLVNEDKLPGRYDVKFETLNIPSGIYIYKLEIPGKILSRKMILLK